MQIWPNFKILGSCTYNCHWLWPNLVCESVLSTAKFCLDHFILLSLRGEKQLHQRSIQPNFQLCWVYVPIPFHWSGLNLACRNTPMVYTYMPNVIWLVYCVTLEGQNPQILPHFQPQHSMVVPSSSTETKLNADSQLPAFPIQQYENHFHIQKPSCWSHSHKLYHSKVLQTYKKLHRTISPLGSVHMRPKTWHGDRVGPYHYCTSKCFWILRTVLQLDGTEIWGKMHPWS